MAAKVPDMMRILTAAAFALMSLGLAACDLGGSGQGAGQSPTQAGPTADAGGQSTPATTTAPTESPALTPAPRGRDGEFGKLPPGGAPAAAPPPSPSPVEQPAVDDPGGEEKP